MKDGAKARNSSTAAGPGAGPTAVGLAPKQTARSRRSIYWILGGLVITGILAGYNWLKRSRETERPAAAAAAGAGSARGSGAVTSAPDASAAVRARRCYISCAPSRSARRPAPVPLPSDSSR
jgi:hypothetical protein